VSTSNVTTAQYCLTPDESLALGLALISGEVIPNENLLIFPLVCGTKIPPRHFTDYDEQASNDPGIIAKWAERYKGCNWAISLPGNMLVPADLDIKPWKGKRGDLDLRELEQQHGKMPVGLIVISPTQGEHRYLRGMHARHNGVMNGIDCPPYLVAPGCKIGPDKDGKGAGEYTIDPLTTLDIPTAPQWWVDLVHSKKDKRSCEAVTQEPAIPLDLPYTRDLAVNYLQGRVETLPRSVSEQNGQGALMQVAARLKDLGISELLAVDLIDEHYNNETNCEPPWDIDELQQKVANAYEYCDETQPGTRNALHDFYVAQGEPIPEEALREPTEEELAERLKKTEERRTWKESQAQPETYQSLLQNYVYVGLQKRFVYRVEREVWDIDAFDRFFANVLVMGKSPATPLSKWILAQQTEGMARYRTFTYVPGAGEGVGGKYNLYVRNDLEPVAGDTSVWDAHLAYLFPDVGERDLVLNWFAWVLQNLGKKPKHALLVHGEQQGTGKSWLTDVLVALIGKDNCTPADQDTLERTHNGFAAHTKLITCEEIRSLGSHRSKASRALHQMITQERVTIDEKNMPPYTLDPFLAAILLNTNRWDAIRPDDTDRRYLVVSTDSVRLCEPKPQLYYKRLFDLLDDRAALAAIYHQLMNRPLGAYTGAGRAPATSAKGKMRDEASDEVERFLIENAAELIEPFSMVRIDDLFDRLPGDLQRKGNPRSEIRRTLAARYQGKPQKSPIRPGGRSDKPFKVWSVNGKPIGREPVALWRQEHPPVTVASVGEDFGDVA
jgi:hypothetical protein